MEENLHKNIQRYKSYVLISINPKIYPLEVVQSAAYAMIDRAYVILDGNPEEEIFVELRPKNKKDMKDIDLQFSNELLNYAVYYNQSKLNKEARNAIMQRVFSTNMGSPEPSETPKATEQTEKYEIEKFDDPLGIAKQWTPQKKVKK
jgi:His-Xaa-Ser system protein HxsD